MASSENRSKKDECGLIRIFRRSMQEMIHVEKSPHTQLLHGKSNRNLSKIDQEDIRPGEPNGGSPYADMHHKPNQVSPPREEKLNNEICRITLDANTDSISDVKSVQRCKEINKDYKPYRREHTPPRFRKSKLHHENFVKELPKEKNRNLNTSLTDENNNCQSQKELHEVSAHLNNAKSSRKELHCSSQVHLHSDRNRIQSHGRYSYNHKRNSNRPLGCHREFQSRSQYRNLNSNIAGPCNTNNSLNTQSSMATGPYTNVVHDKVGQSEDWSLELLNVSDWTNENLGNITHIDTDKLDVKSVNSVLKRLESEESTWSEVDENSNEKWVKNDDMEKIESISNGMNTVCGDTKQCLPDAHGVVACHHVSEQMFVSKTVEMKNHLCELNMERQKGLDIMDLTDKTTRESEHKSEHSTESENCIHSESEKCIVINENMELNETSVELFPSSVKISILPSRLSVQEVNIETNDQLSGNKDIEPHCDLQLVNNEVTETKCFLLGAEQQPEVGKDKLTPADGNESGVTPTDHKTDSNECGVTPTDHDYEENTYGVALTKYECNDNKHRLVKIKDINELETENDVHATDLKFPESEHEKNEIARLEPVETEHGFAARIEPVETEHGFAARLEPVETEHRFGGYASNCSEECLKELENPGYDHMITEMHSVQENGFDMNENLRDIENKIDCFTNGNNDSRTPLSTKGIACIKNVGEHFYEYTSECTENLSPPAHLVMEAENDLSTHGDAYDNLIKEKMKSIKSEKISTIGQKKDEPQCDLHHDIYTSPKSDERRSKSLSGSPYMQIVELMQQFKHKENERNILLEKQKQWQSRFENADLEKPKNCSHIMGRGRATVSLSPLSSISDNTLQHEDWESDLLPVDQFLISDGTDNYETGDSCHKQTVLPASNSYMTVQHTNVNQTPLPFFPKPFVPKGRGCLSPEFKANLNAFLNSGMNTIPRQERIGFDVRNKKIAGNSLTVELSGNNRSQVTHQSTEDWENSLIDIHSFTTVSPVKQINKNQEDINTLEISIAKNNMADIDKEDMSTKSNSNEMENGEFYLMNDSSSMSSLPRCDLLTFSPKSQSTLSGVPTMSDYENSEIDLSMADITTKEFADESFNINLSERKTCKNKCSLLSNETGEFIQKDDEMDYQISDTKINLTGGDKNAELCFIENEINRHYMSNYYPDLSTCHCHPSVQQYWIWHTCLCQVPRLCEIRTSHDYWLHYPFGDMEGIYRTMPIPDINNNNAKGQRQRDDDKPGETDGIRLGPPGFPLLSRKTVIPPPMPFSIGRIPPPPPSQVWEQMLHSRSQVSPCRMAYRGPQPKPKDIPVHLVQQQGPQSTKTVVSPFVCAQEFYQNISSKLRTTASKPSGRGKSDTDNGEHNDSGVVLEGSPGFIGPVLPRNIQLGSPKLLSQEHSKKGLVDYSFSETDESEDDRSRSSQVEKRSREETEGVVVITDDSSSEGESSKRLRILDASRHLKDRKSVLSDVRSFRGDVSSEVKECCQEEGVISADSDDGSSKFHDCSSTLSNYQILQTVLSKKFPENQRKQCSQKRSGDSDLVDLTDDGSEVFSIVSQESTDHAIKSRPTENKGYSPFWASPESRIDSPICGYSVMYPPYTYPGWVSPEMISAGYGHTTPETIQRRHSSISCPSVTASRKIITQDDSLSTSLEDKHPQPQNEEDKLEEKYKRGSVSIRGMEARLRFLKNSKLTEHDTNNIQSRLNMLQKSKQTEGDSDSQSSMTTSWKVRFINKCRSYKGSYIDSHCHLDFLFNRSGFGGTWSKFKVDNQDTMPYNFDGCVAVFCHPGSFRQDGLWSDLAKEEDVWLTFGCHPKNATEYTERTENNMKVCLLNSKVVAVGEIGLDYSGMFEKHKEVQQIVFRKQIQIALDMNKPLVIHCRDAEEDTLAILDEMVPKNYKIHCHCFTGNYESAKKWLDMFPNLFIGLTPLVTYRTATSTHEVARFIPLERLLLETDAPYFVPRKCPRPEVQHSHPGLAITVAEEIAWLKKCPISEVLYSCRQNTRLMYGI